jgi:hypothetical protein
MGRDRKMSIATKGYKRNQHGVIEVWIQLDEVEGGLSFTSPVDGTVTIVKGISLETFRHENRWWWDDKYVSDILDAISDMGGGEWAMYDGGRTEYEYGEDEGDGIKYLIVSEHE